jgi:phosphoacetylglucosamine mutase
MQIMNINIAEWDAMYTDFPSKQVKVPVVDKNLISCSPDETRVVSPSELQHQLDEAMANTPCGRCFVRPSGTEDCVRIYAEAETQALSERLALDCIRALNNTIGIVGSVASHF